MRDWLAALNLGHLAEVFEVNEVDLSDLALLSEDDLKDLGLALGPRRRILNALAGADEPRATPPAATSTRRDTGGSAERRQLTIMFCDLVGSTELSQRLDPEDLRDVMGRYQDAVAGAVSQHGGQMAKFLGDGVLAYFGWPQAHEDQAERAVRAGLAAAAVSAVTGGIAVTDQTLRARIGIASGQVVVGDLVGDAASESQAVSGQTPNLAARLQGIARPEQVVIGATTRQLIGGLFTLEDLGRHPLKGFAEPVAA